VTDLWVLDAVYGEPIEGEQVVVVEDPAVAQLLAVAHQRVHGRRAGVAAGGRIERVVGYPPAGARWIEPGDDVLEVLVDADNPMVVAGPGVVVAGAVADLHALAASASLGVLNTWGAKGVFDWRSRHHLATAGLQVRDFELGGLQAADVVLATGIDPLEAPDALWRNGPARVVDVEPGALGLLAERWHRPHQPIEVPALRSALAAVTEDGWRAEGSTMAPSRATWHYGQVAVSGGLVAADAGVGGYWVARTLPTAELGSVVVPAERSPGFAAACCLVARLRNPRRPVLAVADEEPVAVLAAARALGVAIPVEVWSPAGVTLDPTAHWTRLTDLVGGRVGGLVTLATDPGQLAAMVDAAGPIAAWGGLAPRP
jgi:hypothetical protein